MYRLNKHALHVLGRKLNMSEEQLRNALNPEHFIEIRSLEGGPNKERMEKTIAVRREQQRELNAWLDEKKEILESAKHMIDCKLKSIMMDGK